MLDLNDKISKALIIKFLSECFHNPDKEQVVVLKDYKAKLPQRFSDIIDKMDRVKELQVDYAKLFLGPFELLSAPYGSIYLEEGRKTFGDSTMDLLKLYQQENLSLQLNELPDHITIELEFLYYLMVRELELLDVDDLEQAKLYVEKQMQFINRYLAKWVNDFANLVEENASCHFYRQIAICLKQEIKEFQLIVN